MQSYLRSDFHSIQCILIGQTDSLRVVGEESEAALSELMDPLLGPIRRTSDTKWEDTVLGLPKHGLLREVLRELYRHRSMQRLVTRYHEMLEESERPPP